MYPWPLGEFDNVMDVALEIAMDYLDRTGQAVRFRDAQSIAAAALARASKVGIRHQSSWPTPGSKRLSKSGRVMEPRFGWEGLRCIIRALNTT
jgi:hypothetical protein